MTTDECPVCLHELAMTQVLPCSHSICSACLCDLLRTSAPSCPMCRGAIRGCDPPIVNHLAGNICCKLARHSMEDPLGVVIASEDDRIVVRNVDPHGFARAMGLQEYDELISVNGLPCIKQNQGVVQDVLRSSPCLQVWVSRGQVSGVPIWQGRTYNLLMSYYPLWWQRNRRLRPDQGRFTPRLRTQ